MSDEQQYAVWPDPRSRSQAFQSWKSFYFQTLSPLFTVGAGNWPLILKLGHNIWIWSGRIFYICPTFCVTWLRTWQKRQLWRIDRQSHMGLIYYCVVFATFNRRHLCIFVLHGTVLLYCIVRYAVAVVRSSLPPFP